MNYAAIRSILYDILTAGSDSEPIDIKAMQNMGVALSPAVSRQGTNIIQLQSVVNSKVINKVTDALKMIDTAEADDRTVEVLEAEEVPKLPEPETLQSMVEEKLDNDTTLKDFISYMESFYILKAIEYLGEDDAKRILKIRKQRVAAALAKGGS